MKLHLPKQLFTALIAAMTSIALSTGAAYGGLTTTTTNYDAAGNVIAPDDTTTEVADTIVVDQYDGNNNGAIDIDRSSDVDKIIFNMSAGGSNWFDLGNNRIGAFANEVQIGAEGSDGTLGMVITAGSDNVNQTFSGKVYGAGKISYSSTGAGYKINFTGDVSDYTGEIELGATAGSYILTFGNGGSAYGSNTAGVSGTGAIVFTTSNNTLVYNYNAAKQAYVTNAISASENGISRVTITNGDMVFTKENQIDILTITAGTATFNNGVALDSVSNSGSLVFGSDTVVSLGSTMTGSGSVSFAEGATINLSTSLWNLNGTLEHGHYGYVSSVDLLADSTADREVSVSVNGQGGYTMAADGTVSGLTGVSSDYVIAGDVTTSTILGGGDNLTQMASLVVKSGTLTVDKDWSVQALSGNGGSINLTKNLTLLQDSTLSATTLKGAGELVIANGSTLTVNSTGKNIKSNIRIGAGATLEFLGTGADAIDYNQAGRTIYVDGGKIDVGTTRQTVGKWNFELTGATIEGAGQSSNVNVGLDFHSNSIVKALGATDATAANPTISTISTKVRNNGTMTYDVAENARLNITGGVLLNNTVTKDGKGVLFMNGSVSGSGSIDVKKGTLATGSSSTLGISGNITIREGALLDVTAWSDKSTFGSLNSKTTLTTEGKGFIKMDVLNTDDGRELALSGNTTLNKNFWFTDTSVAFHASSVSRTITIGSGRYLKAEEGVQAWSDATIKVDGGQLEAKYIVLGHYTGADGGHYGALEMASGSITTESIKFNKQVGNTVNITGGSLEFTSDAALHLTHAHKTKDTNASISIVGGEESPVTLKATKVAWTLDGSGLTTAPKIGNVIIDAANTEDITLKNINITGTITNNASLTLGGAITVEGAELSVEVPTGSNGYEQVTGDLSKLTGSGSYVAATGLTINGITVSKLSNVDDAVTALSGSYHVINGTADYNTGDAGLDISSDATAAIVLNGGNLNMLSSLNENTSGGIQVKQNATITLGYKEAMLNSSALQIDSGAVVLAGSGIYNLDYNLESRHDLGDNISLAPDWAGTIQVTGDLDDLSASIEDLDTTSAAKVRLHGVQGWLKAATNAANHANSADFTLSADIELINKGSTSAWKIDDGYSINGDGSENRYAIISGNISGTGDIEFNASVSPQYNLTGDISQWEGNLKVMKNPLVIVLQDNATTVNAGMLAGQGSSGAGTLNLVVDNSGKLTSFNNVVRVSSLELTEGSQAGFNYSDAANSIGLLTAGSGAVSVGENVFLTLGGGTADTRKEHVIGTLSSGAGAGISLGDYATLALGAGTAEKQKEHEIGNISTGNSAGISLGDYATLTLSSTLPNRDKGNNTGNNDADSSLNLNITGGEKSRLNLNLTTNVEWQHNNTVSLKALTEGGKTVDDVYVQSGYLAADVFSGTAKTNLGGATLHVGTNAGDGTSGLLIRGKDKEISFGTGEGGIQIDEGHTADMFLYGGTRTLMDSISGDHLRIVNGSGDSSEGGIKFAGNLELATLTNEAKADVELNGSKVELGTLVVNNVNNNETGARTIVNSNANIAELKVQKGSLVVGGENNSVKAGNFTISNKNASLSNVTVSGNSMTASSTEAAKKGSVSNAVVQIDELAEDASFTIAEMNFSNASISAAKGIKVKLEKITASDTLLTGGGSFNLYVNPQEMTLAEATAEGMNRTLTYRAGLGVSGEGTTLTLNLDVINTVAPDQHGVYDISIVLNGFGEGFVLDETIAGMVKFDPESWLAKALEGVTPTVMQEGAEAIQASNDGPTVTYAAGTGENVGSLVITINGLNVPEPTTSTLSLLALAALAARRRRRC